MDAMPSAEPRPRLLYCWPTPIAQCCRRHGCCEASTISVATEASLAQRLMMGESPEQAAQSLSIKISTARWHLSSIYRKTGTRRQADLVRILLSLPKI